MKRTSKLLILSALSGIAAPAAFAAFDTLSVFGDAVGTTPPASFTGNGTGTTTITAGGADFWGTADIGGAFLYDSTGTYTTTGDFTATVRHVSTDNPAPEWGRDGILVRATAGQAVVGTPQTNDPNFMSFRKSNGAVEAGVRSVRGTDYNETLSDTSNPGFAGPGVATNSYFLGAARQGNVMRVSSAINLGTEAVPVAGRWVQSGTHTVAAFNAGAQVIVGLGHQAHGLPRVNTATFDNWNYSGSYDASRFGAAAGAGATPWSVNGAVAVNTANGAVNGRAFVQVGGVATGESTKWALSAGKYDTFVPAYGAAGAVRRSNPFVMEVADIVAPSRFRQSAAIPSGLTADIYLAANAGNLAGNQAIINAATPPNGSTIIPSVNWTGGGTTTTQYYQGTSSDFRAAVAAGTGPATTFGNTNQENYGVHMNGQIFIPGDADRKGHFNNVVLFKDGIDDFTYLNIDGQVLLNDNDWSGFNGTDNNGSHVTAMNVSDAKYDDGEWVSFEMIMWEGGGGDNGVLYSDMDDVNGTFVGSAPGTYGTAVLAGGTAQVGSEAANGSFGTTLIPGQWDVFLTVSNTGTAANFVQGVTVVPEPTAPLLISLSALGAFLRRRRSS